VCVTRILVKFIILLFPIFGVLSILENEYLHLWPILAFLCYMGLVSFLLLAYELLTCCCFSVKYPYYIFTPNDLQKERAHI
jgi:hypothetical protein